MKKVLVACALLGSSTAFAADAFTGFSVELGAASRTFEGSVSDYRINGNAIPTSVLSFDKIDKTKTIGEVGLKYSWEIGPQYLLSLSYERALQDAKLGAPSVVINGQRQVIPGQIKVSDAQAFVFQPGIKLSDSTAVSLRVGYATSTVRLQPAGESEEKIDTKTLLTGIGVTQMLGKNLYVGGSFDILKSSDEPFSAVEEGVRVSYNFETKGKAFRAFVGYRF